MPYKTVVVAIDTEFNELSVHTSIYLLNNVVLKKSKTCLIFRASIITVFVLMKLNSKQSLYLRK